ncbi:MAG: serine protease [Nitrospiraceae bacterium]|nr:MAG: serine protease [Nitrospiraceae bacterium]
MIRIIFIIAIVCFVIPQVFAEDINQKKSIRTFTNKDLQKYPEIPLQPAEQFKGYSFSTYTPSSQPVLNGDTIFKENNQAVVAVIVLDRENTILAHGSGFIVSPKGLVVTSYHVVRNAPYLRILAGEELLAVEGLVYRDKDNDTAVLKVIGSNLRSVRLGSTENLIRGEPVYVMSNPGGDKTIISEGTLSGIEKFGRRKRMLQVTAPFSQGSSGGPAFNKHGEVIGIATATVSSSQNVNFVVSIERLKDMLTSGEVSAFSDTFGTKDKRSADYWLERGGKFNASGRYTEAIEAYQRAIKKDEKLVSAYNGLGVAYMELKQFQDAERVFREALQINPDFAWIHSNLGLLYTKTGRYEEAIPELKKAIDIMPDLENAHLNLGSSYRWLRMYQKAHDAYKEALRINPDSAFAHYALGMTYRDLKDLDSAREEYLILKDLDPELAKDLSRWIQ